MFSISQFRLHKKKNIEYFTVLPFSETGLVKHAFSTHKGGISKGDYEGLNLGLHTGDEKINVLRNRGLFTEALDIPIQNLVTCVQIHGDQIYHVKSQDKGKGILQGKDALITNESGIAIMLFFADCVPVMFLDPVKKVIAIAHAGWKGTVLKIAVKTIKDMCSCFGCSLDNIMVAIGPSIGPCHYEVDGPVIRKVRDELSCYDKFLVFKSKEKAFLDLWEANRIQIMEAGVKKNNIFASELCTYCYPELFYSFRRDKGKTGRLGALIMLN